MQVEPLQCNRRTESPGCHRTWSRGFQVKVPLFCYHNFPVFFKGFYLWSRPMYKLTYTASCLTLTSGGSWVLQGSMHPWLEGRMRCRECRDARHPASQITSPSGAPYSCNHTWICHLSPGSFLLQRQGSQTAENEPGTCRKAPEHGCPFLCQSTLPPIAEHVLVTPNKTKVLEDKSVA